jgi:hypothetical protein
MLVNGLIDWARSKGYKTCILSTLSLMGKAFNFYSKYGFELETEKKLEIRDGHPFPLCKATSTDIMVAYFRKDIA